MSRARRMCPWQGLRPEPFLNVLEERKAFAGVPDEKGVEIYIPESADKTILVSMTLKDITPTGLTVHFNQYNRADCGELIYGESYHLQVLKEDDQRYLADG